MFLLGETGDVITPPKSAQKGEVSSDASTLQVGSYPNPFNPTTTINFILPEEGRVTLKVYDALGRLVATLIDENRRAGSHRVVFDASSLASGVYFYRLEALGKVLVNKLVILR